MSAEAVGELPAAFAAESWARAWEGVCATVTGVAWEGVAWCCWLLCFLLEKKDILPGRPGCGRDWDCFVEEKSGMVSRRTSVIRACARFSHGFASVCPCLHDLHGNDISTSRSR